MKRIVLLGLLLLQVSIFYGSCTLPVAGKRVWDIAQDNSSLTCLIEEKVRSLDSAVSVDFAGTFTVLDRLFSLVLQLESSAEILDTQLDILLQDITRDLSITDEIEQDVITISSQVELASYNMQRIFSALDNLETTVVIQLNVLNSGLEQLDSTMFSLIEMEIADSLTIMSNLETITQEVQSINSILDHITIESQLEISSSLISLLEISYQTLNSNVDLLSSIIATGFAGTFTALEQNLQEACTIESLIDAIPATFYVDLSSTYSALQALQSTMNTVDSQVDTVQELLFTINSEIDLLSSKFYLIESELPPLESQTALLADDTVALSLLDQDITLLTKDYSIIDLLSKNELQSKAAIIINTIESVESALESQNSLLEIVADDLADDTSKVVILEIENATIISRLSVISSELDQAFNKTLTIESLLDAIETESLVDALLSKSQLLASELTTIEVELLSVSSQLDIFNGLVPGLDTILLTAVDNLSLAEIIESNVSHIIVNQSESDLLISKLSVIEGQVTTISSKMTIVDSRLSADILLAEDLITDFQETWTILNSIGNILISDQLGLQTISSKLGHINLTDLSSVYTVINGIIQQKYTLDTQVDEALSLIDALDTLIVTDFSAVFTALNVVTQGEQTINSQIDALNTDVNSLIDYFGTPIYNSDLGISGYVITQPGRYYLAENINYSGSSNAITISSNDVFLDLDEYVLTNSTTNSAILINSNNNIQVANGSIVSQALAIQVSDGATNIIFNGLNIQALGNAVMLGVIQNVIIADCIINGIAGTGGAVVLNGPKNVNMRDTQLFGVTVDSSDITNMYVSDCVTDLMSSQTNAFGMNGVTQNYVIKNVSAVSNTVSGPVGTVNSAGINDSKGLGNGIYLINSTINGFFSGGIINHSSGSVFVDNTIINSGVNNAGGQTGNILLAGGSNSAVLFNNVTNSPTNNVNEIAAAGANTILGNFAFNSTATGNPNNTNYTISGASNITNKYQTVSQKGSFGDYVTGWHNINMLP